MYQQYATSEPPPAFIFSNSPFLALSNLPLATYIVLGGYFLNNSCLALPSRNCSLRNIATLFPSGTNSNAFVTNSEAYLYGGLVIISPLNGFFHLRKSTSPRPYPLSIKSLERTLYQCNLNTSDKCPSPQAGSHIVGENFSSSKSNSAAFGSVA